MSEGLAGVSQRLDGVNARLEDLRTDVNARLASLGSDLETIATDVGETKLHIEWLRAQIRTASAQAADAALGRT